MKLKYLLPLLVPVISVNAETHNVNLIGDQFVPSQLAINVGDTVIWTQRENVQHNVQSDSNIWISPDLTTAGQTYERTFESAGEFPYYCVYHFGMTGNISVNATEDQPPTVSITSPDGTAGFSSPGTIRIQTEASDADGDVTHVEFYNGETLLGVATKAPFELLVTLRAGEHTLTANAVDDSGLETVSGPVAVSVTSSPEVSAGNVSTGENGVAVEITGGGGPFVLQRTDLLPDAIWINETLTEEASATSSDDDPQRFLRLADLAESGAIAFSTWMSGDAERQAEPVETTATGSGLFRLDGDLLTFNIRYEGLSATASAAHIHGPAPASESAGVLIDLAPHNGGGFGTGGTLAGAVILNAPQKAALLSGKTYVNVHTANFPGGEIRGQIAPVVMQASLKGIHERPDRVDTPASGFGAALLIGNRLYLDLTYQGLTAPASAAHIHGTADTGTSAGVLVDLAPYNGGSFGGQGTITGEIELSNNHLASVIDGLTYINIHTSNHPGGEIRGQILPHLTSRGFTASMSSAAEVGPNPVVSDGTGSGSFLLEGNVLNFSLRYEALTGPASAAHIHGPGPASQSAGVLIDLAPFNGGAFGDSGFLSGSVVLNETQRQHITSGQTYVNIHTAANPGGEIRGQIAPVLMGATLNGLNERQANTVITPASGFGTLLLAGDDLHFNVFYQDLKDVATASHIHGPADADTSAGVLIGLDAFNGGAYGTSGTLAGELTLTQPNLGRVIDGRTYINIHTPSHPGGEIRGQILP